MEFIKKWKIPFLGGIVVLIAAIGLFFFFSGKQEDTTEQPQTSDTTTFSMAKNYSYFDVSLEQFHEAIQKEFATRNIEVSEIKEIHEDVGFYSFQYEISLDNQDRILLASSTSSDIIDYIGYDFTNNPDAAEGGFFVGVMTRWFVSNLDLDDFSQKALDDFFAKEETFSQPNSYTIYEHLVYGVHLSFDELDQVNEAYLTIAPTSETTVENYLSLFSTSEDNGENSNQGNDHSNFQEEQEDNSGSNVTVSQQNAVNMAIRYISTMSFSKEGLIDQLEYEGFSTADATYGAEHCGADWYQEAIKTAESYLDTMAFSKQGLLDQLEYEGFTSDEANYGISNISVDWNEQAAKKAKEYLDAMSFSRQGLMDQLLYEGFTNSEAIYGATANGF